MTTYRGKRALDLALAVPAVIGLSPVMFVIAALVAWGLGRPVIFRQTRPGLDGRPFTMYKFRTMREEYDSEGRPRPDGDRLTPFGRFLRSTSLDELPELVNVLRGDMGLVGPRPLLMEYLDRYSPEQRRRHAVKPGITGWAQVHGRNALSWDEKFAHDVWYVDHQSLWLDLRILVLTCWKVLARDGITQPGEATATEFFGQERSRESRG